MRRSPGCQDSDDTENNSVDAAPFGSWPSPLRAADVAAGAVRRAEPRIADGWAYWVEERPLQRGRGAVVRVPLNDPEAQPADVPGTADADIRTSVHEYGGGAWLPLVSSDGSHFVLGACMGDQRLRLFDAQGCRESIPVTAEPPVPRAHRYADPALVPATAAAPSDGATFDPVTVWVREAHDESEREPRNEIVAVRLDGTITVVAGGADFYAAPRPSPDGTMLAYLSWDHPNMPWDYTRLHLVELHDGAPVPGTDRVLVDGPALQQPRWGPDGELHVVTDAGGWWAIHQVDAGTAATEPILGDLAEDDSVGREFGIPSWVFAQATYGWSGDGSLWCTWMSGGIGHLGVVRGGALAEIESGFTDFGRLAVSDRGTVVTVAASWTQRAAVVEIASDGTHRQLSDDEPLALAPDDISVPRLVTFDSAQARRAHAFCFPPANTAVESAPRGLPPLVVLSHGGPTGAARSSLDLGIQYWTTRGIAVVDVNYGGSTGFGTDYRNLLAGQWGVVDTQDCIAAALHLADAGEADPERLVIKGGSAGGYTTLCALTQSDVFAAGLCRYGVADLSALARDTHKFEARYLDGLVGPWPDAEALYRERSPIWRTDQLRTPMIVLQGTDDRVVPPSQSEQLVAALASAGVPHAYLLFDGEGHGFRQAPNIVAALEAELSFLGQVLGFTPADDITPVEVR
ncbi:S9 family peptidase [Candidatus Poriferisodalis sp.]|uniref:S9 family peptidase n=1 Tax=Candidatus Poriferisodalis sp. TaxID=3101277 RepID=UPI003B01D76F